MANFSGLPPILLGALAGMDVQGEKILGTYLYGGGKDHDIVDDPQWTSYMMANEGLRRQIFGQLVIAVKDILARKRKGRFPFAEKFHAECPENSGFSGYALLHGTDRTVGDFKLIGWAEVRDALEPADDALDIDLDLRFVFNDIVNPNKKYLMDRIRSTIGDIFTLGSPESYRLSISWGSKCLAEIRPGRPIEIYGYPSDKPIGVRPVGGARLDWVSGEKKRAKEIETKIILQLRRNIFASDCAGIQDRKQRLLWLFYRLSGYWGGTYIDRINRAAMDDELSRLLRQRLSHELRAEIMNALHGKRPPGIEPA